jgi:hypothetical protein
MAELDPDLAFAFGEERVLRSVSRGALWLATLVCVVSAFVLRVPPAGTITTLPYVALLVPGAALGAYAVARGGGLLPLLSGTLAPLAGLVSMALVLAMFDSPPFVPNAGDALGLLAVWALSVGVSLLVGVPLRLLDRE